MTSRTGLLHLNLNVASLEISERFYVDGLGFELVERSEELADFGSGEEPVRQAILTLPGTGSILALTHAPTLPVGSHGLNHFGVVVEPDTDLMPILDRVVQCGGSVQKSGRRDSGEQSELYAYVRDPDGYAVELSCQSILYSRME